MIELNKIVHADCMDIMKDIPDKYFDLAIVDPPYGIGEDGGKDRRTKSRYIKKFWDIKPEENYFNELFRVSQNRIIFGANYFFEFLYSSSGIICWDKKLYNSDFSDFEFIWTSFNRSAKIFQFSKNGGSRNPAVLRDLIHPCQKPINLYRWLLQNYAKIGDKIIDTHSGSGSCAIACYLEKFDFLAIEKDKDYFDASVKRFNEIKQQYTFNFSDIIQEELHQGILL